MGAESSQRERRADDASRDVMGYLKCLYMQPRIGEIFDATISSALEFGLFVQLKDMPVDGLVHISNIPATIGNSKMAGWDWWVSAPAGVGNWGTR